VRAVLIRHAETAHNRGGLVQGRADNPLSELGSRQAEALGLALAAYPFAAVCSSPLQRSQRTALAVAQHHRLTVSTEPDLIEMEVGELEGLSGALMRERYPEFMQSWASEHVGTAMMPGGESLEQVQLRAGAVLDRLSTVYPERTVAVVSHNFVILTLVCRALSLPLKDFRKLRHHVAGTTIIEYEPGRSALLRMNDVCHLERAGVLGDDPFEGRR
jgi:broad specificity phosphatase PhoE